MWRKIKEILCKHTVYKDESTNTSPPDTITASVIDLKPLPPTVSQRTEILHHHHHRPYRKAIRKSTLNKTDEHSRSLLNLLPTSLRARHQQTANNKGTNTSTTTQISPIIDIYRTDYDSGYMSQSILNRTPSYTSCYSAVATTMPISSMNRHGSIENLLQGHSKSNPANIRVLIRKNFEPFSQAHIAVTKGMIVTALFPRGPWLYIRNESNGQTGYIPRIICSLYRNSNRIYKTNIYQHNLSLSSTDSLSNKDNELDLTVISTNNDKYLIHPYKQDRINRYLSHSTAIINDQQTSKEKSTKRLAQICSDERERRNTCTLPQPFLTSSVISSKDRRLTLGSINWPITTKTKETIAIHQMSDVSTTTALNNERISLPQRDTDSSSTQDSGYSESTPYFLVQQATSDIEPISKKSSSSSSSNYATIRRSSLAKAPNSMNTYHNSLRRHHTQTNKSDRPMQYRHTLFNGLSMNDILPDNINKRHSFGTFYTNNNDNYNQSLTKSINTINNSLNSRPIDFALIRNVRRDKDDLHQCLKPSIHNLPKSYRQIPASIFLNHHRQLQKQQFGSSHSAFRPVQTAITTTKTKSKRASSEGHSPSSENQRSSSTNSTSSSSLSSSTTSSSLSNINSSHSFKHRRLSCDITVPIITQDNLNSLTRSVCDQQISMKKLNYSSRTMSDTICDQFSEINLDAIEKDSLVQPIINKKQRINETISNNKSNLFTITKDYRSSRASFSVKRGDYVYILKQVGRACFLVRKQNTGQVGFVPKALMIPTATTKIDTFLEMHGYRETVI